MLCVEKWDMRNAHFLGDKILDLQLIKKAREK